MTGSDESTEPSISDDCTRFAFKSAAKDLTGSADGNGDNDVFHEGNTGDAVLVSHRAASHGEEAAGSGASDSPILSRDGNWLAYASLANDLRTAGQNDTTAPRTCSCTRSRAT